MGIRSDVGICVKKEFVSGLEEIFKKHDWDANETREAEEGNAYVFKYIKWYKDWDDVREIDDYLQSIGGENFKVIEACHDYPESTDGDDGDWNDNPFSMSRNIEVSISLG